MNLNIAKLRTGIALLAIREALADPIGRDERIALALENLRLAARALRG